MADRYIKGQSVFKGFSSRADNSNFKLYDFALIKQDLINRLSVRKGERVENPEFGTIIYDVLFEPLTDDIKQAVADDITANLNADPRLQTEEIIVSEFEHGIAVQASIRFVLSVSTLELGTWYRSVLERSN